jgi:hypothetical protein
MSGGCVYTKIRTIYICGTLMMWVPVLSDRYTQQEATGREDERQRSDATTLSRHPILMGVVSVYARVCAGVCAGMRSQSLRLLRV